MLKEVLLCPYRALRWVYSNAVNNVDNTWRVHLKFHSLYFKLFFSGFECFDFGYGTHTRTRSVTYDPTAPGSPIGIEFDISLCECQHTLTVAAGYLWHVSAWTQFCSSSSVMKSSCPAQPLKFHLLSGRSAVEENFGRWCPLLKIL